MKILVVDDDARLCHNIKNALAIDLYLVDAVNDGLEAMYYIKDSHYDLLVLDWMLPGKSGLELCEYARSHHFDGGILMLTAKDSTDDIITGLDHGADDYMIKPFKLEELRARVRALLRRKNKIIEQVISSGSLTINKTARTAFIDNVELTLTKNEFLLLEYLLNNKGQLLTHDQIIEYIWGLEESATSNSLAALVRLVRKKIDIDNEPSYIENVRGLGYRLRGEHV